MYLRSTPRRNKDGSTVRYLQLAHNVWDPVAKRSKVQVIYNFGREDAANREALARLVASVSRFLDPDAALAAQAEGMEFLASRPLGGIWVLEGLWKRLAIGNTMRRLLKGRRRDAAVERVLFALVANRALAPSSKLAASRWMNNDVLIDGLGEVTDDACYRAMDFLLEITDELEKEVFGQLATLLNLEVDLLFFDTTSTYFETEDADTPVPRDGHGRVLPDGQELPEDGKERGFRSFGKSKDSRDDLPQVVIGMAVTRTGIPVRVWSWPGATGDSALIRQVKDDMRDWTLSKIVWVADRGFVWVPNTVSPYATWAYSWRRPPSLSRRMALISASTGSGSARSGLAWFRARCRRWVLKWASYSARTLRRCRALMMRIRSRSSRRTLPTHRSMIAFIRGACGAVSTTRIPSALNTSSNSPVNLLSRSRIRKRKPPARSPRSSIRLRAC
jgi:hypothetical protein